jgi:3-hydroxybutyryl-CoA dehydrogenase
MINFNKHVKIGVLGAGTMGAGISQVAATAGHNVTLCDANAEALTNAVNSITGGLMKLVEKGKIDAKKVDEIIERISTTENIEDFAPCGLVIEAIVEDISVKKSIFSKFETIVKDTCFLASNTSSLSIGSIASACKHPERVIGLHFFNPAQILPLVEIVPSILTERTIADMLYELMKEWGKVPVMAKDTPGFIVNKVARPFYGEALRIYEEGIAGFADIDYAMKTIGGFRMGPFELMDLIGNDVNYKVTETVFNEFYYDGRYKPSITQKRYVEAGLLGRKSGRGFYDYSTGAVKTEPTIDAHKAKEIFERIIVMLINEAADTLHRGIASKEDIDLAVTKGVNYPKGLLHWADEIGVEKVYYQLKSLYDIYFEERYRPSPNLRLLAIRNRKFYQD